jgi:nicotinamidase/pyrazinamidase
VTRRIVVDVDTQVDFVRPEGALYVPAPASVPERIASVLAQAQAAGDPIVGSVDAHAWDAWEFAEQGGPFPPHCVKGSPGWLRITPGSPARTRFVPVQPLVDGQVRMLAGEAKAGSGARVLDAQALAAEAMAGVGLYFEKEVYSLFANPLAEPVLGALVHALGGPGEVCFEVLGYCTGGYCVDAAAQGLRQRGWMVVVRGDATAAIGGAEGQARSRRELTAAGVQWREA